MALFEKMWSCGLLVVYCCTPFFTWYTVDVARNAPGCIAAFAVQVAIACSLAQMLYMLSARTLFTTPLWQGGERDSCHKDFAVGFGCTEVALMH